MPGHTGAKKKKNKKMPKMGGGYKRGGKVTKSRCKKKGGIFEKRNFRILLLKPRSLELCLLSQNLLTKALRNLQL